MINKTGQEEMKFILMIQICSAIAGACSPPMASDPIYNSFKECAIFGYEISAKYLEEMSDEKVNSEQIYTKFWCKSIEST